MVLITAILIVLFEAISEGLINRTHSAFRDFIFKWWMQWIIAFVLFGAWFIFAYNYNKYYVNTLKLILGFIFVRFMIFDVAYNLANGQKWNYYGKVKLYDKVMFKLGSWGWFMKGVLGIVGICFLMGWE
jgi:hypothetical protein